MGGGITSIVMNAGTATVNWIKQPFQNTWSFSITGATNTCLNAASKNAGNVTANSFTFPAGCANGTYTAATDPNLKINVWATRGCPSSTIAPADPCNPIIPNHAFSPTASGGLINSANQAANRPKITWPLLGGGDPVTIENWMGNAQVSDYTDLYWQLSPEANFRAYPTHSSLRQNLIGMETTWYDRLANLQMDKPILFLTGNAGADYAQRGVQNAITSISGGTITTAGAHTAAAASRMNIDGSSSGACNGNWTVSAIGSPTQVTANGLNCTCVSSCGTLSVTNTTEYTPGQDYLIAQPTPLAWPASGPWMSALLGAAGTRMYAFDTMATDDARRSQFPSLAGQTEAQTFAHPEPHHERSPGAVESDVIVI